MANIDLATVLTGAAVAAAAAGITYAVLSRGNKPKGSFACNATDLAPGNMKEVKIGEHTVLLVHTVTGKFLATGAKCTHYGAPLAKGVLNGERIVCQWHASCFNACTGDIEDGPGLDALPSFPVEVTDGKVYITLPEKIPRGVQPTLCGASKSNPEHFVIVGAGPAGGVAAETLRANGFLGRITMLARDNALPFDRTKLSKNMAVSADELNLRSQDVYTKADVNVRFGVTVTRLRPDSHELELSNGEVLPYTKVLCASGGPPRTFRAPESFVVAGADLEGIFPLRDVIHSSAIEATVNAKGPGITIVVVGSSFIGMEAAAYLAKVKKCTNLTIVGMETEPFERVLGTTIGAFMRRLHEGQGVAFRMAAVVDKFTGVNGRVKSVVLKSGEELPAELVIIGAGIIPATDYLKGAAGVKLHDKAPGGVVVDECLKAADDVYAAGDIAYFPYTHSEEPGSAFVRIEHWDVALDQGRVAALNMLGTKTPFECVPFFWTAQYGKSLRYAGYASKNNDVIIHGSMTGPDASFTAYFVVNNRVAALASLNCDPQVAAGMELLRLGQFPTPAQLRAAGKFDLSEYLRQRTLQHAK